MSIAREAETLKAETLNAEKANAQPCKKASKANESVFNRAMDQVTQAAQELLDSLVTNAPPRDREIEAGKAHVKAEVRFTRK